MEMQLDCCIKHDELVRLLGGPPKLLIIAAREREDSLVSREKTACCQILNKYQWILTCLSLWGLPFCKRNSLSYAIFNSRRKLCKLIFLRNWVPSIHILVSDPGSMLVSKNNILHWLLFSFYSAIVMFPLLNTWRKSFLVPDLAHSSWIFSNLTKTFALHIFVFIFISMWELLDCYLLL